MTNMARPRIVPRGTDTNIKRVGARDSPLRDLYHALLLQPWSQLFGFALLAYLAFNAAFALIYARVGGVGGARPGSFFDALAFSVQTSTTIGYGTLAPASPAAHAVVTVQAFMGLVAFALLTGLVFAKFSRPTARVIFSERAVVAMHDGVPCLMFRMANERFRSRIVEAELRLTLLRDETSREGVYMRRFHDMRLVRARTPVFAMSWTAMHPIDAESPLAGSSPKSMQEQHAEVVLSFVGIDETMSQTIHGRFSYVTDEIAFGERFVDVIEEHDGQRVFNYQRFHQTHPVQDGAAEAVAALGDRA